MFISVTVRHLRDGYVISYLTFNLPQVFENSTIGFEWNRRLLMTN